MVRPFASVFSVLVALVGLGGGASGTDPQGVEAGAPTAVDVFDVEATRVLVDVIVRDRDGRPVTDLTAEDFEVLEDGVAQKIESFTLVHAPAPSPAASVSVSPAETPQTDADVEAREGEGGAAGQGGRLAPPPEHATIALVFDSLSTEGRVAAEKAAHEFVDHGRRPDDRVGVFSVAEAFTVLQDFTSDAAALHAGVEAAGTDAAHSGPSLAERELAAANRNERATTAALRYTETGRPSSSAEGIRKAQLGIRAAELGILATMAENFDRIVRDRSGFATAEALAAIVDALRSVQGRKAAILLTEGLFKTDANESRLQSVVHSANRANVAVYAVAAGRLQGLSTQAIVGRQVNNAGRLSQMRTIASDADLAGVSMLRDLERTSDLVRYDPRASLEWITERTGGFFVRDTNDLEGALERIDGDLRSYYLLGYVPRGERWDGRFREIEVKVRRKGARVRARSGYFAVRSVGPILGHVAPVLALLENRERPDAFPIFGGALPFSSGDGAARVSVVVGVPGEGVLDSAKDASRLDLTLVARVLDEEGRPVEAVSRRFVADARDGRTREAEHRLLRDVWLEPGRYRLEAAAYDSGSGAATVTTRAFEVGPRTSSLDAAQLMLVREVLPVGEAGERLDPGHPLRYGEVQLYPSVGEPFEAAAGRPLVFQLVWPADGDPPDGALSLWRGSERLGASPVAWAPAGDDGWVRFVGELPLAGLEAGRHEVRVVLVDGESERELVAPFEVRR